MEARQAREFLSNVVTSEHIGWTTGPSAECTAGEGAVCRCRCRVQVQVQGRSNLAKISNLARKRKPLGLEGAEVGSAQHRHDLLRYRRGRHRD